MAAFPPAEENLYNGSFNVVPILTGFLVDAWSKALAAMEVFCVSCLCVISKVACLLSNVLLFFILDECCESASRLECTCFII